MKTCLTCGEVKGKEEFRGNRNHCRKCNCAKRTPEQQRNSQLKYRYGITLEEYSEMQAAQRGQCYICNKEAKLFVDHCHDTEQVRKLLCNECNALLGFAYDSPTILRLAASYLEQHDRNRFTPN